MRSSAARSIAVLVGRRRHGPTTQLTRRAMLLLSGASTAALLVMFVIADERARCLYPAGFLVVQAATAALIITSLRPGPTSTALGTRTMRWLGTRSYGIYLWHWPLVALFRPGIDVTWPRPVTVVFTTALAITLGAVSYRFVERPFLAEDGWARRPLPRPTRVYGVAWVAAMLAHRRARGTHVDRRSDRREPPRRRTRARDAGRSDACPGCSSEDREEPDRKSRCGEAGGEAGSGDAGQVAVRLGSRRPVRSRSRPSETR